MRIDFHKYHGTGNDFILIDARDHSTDIFPQDRVKALCDRRLGIGADGLILLKEHHKLDFYMQYFNSDGRESTMCGNGGRCITSFAKKLNLIDREAHFEAVDGLHYARVLDNSICLRMKTVDNIYKTDAGWWLDTGSPHLVITVDHPQEKDVYAEGRAIRYSEAYAGTGVNIDFVRFGDQEVEARTYERGVEQETLSCGTGAIASAICSAIDRKNGRYSIPVRMPGGLLTVHFVKNEPFFEDVYLEGPAQFVFSGTYYS